MKLIFDAVPSFSARSYIFSSALLVIAFPVADMSFPAPDVVLQALSREAAPASTKRLIKIVARFLRIGASLWLLVVRGSRFRHIGTEMIFTIIM
jgi:hypothetical protein